MSTKNKVSSYSGLKSPQRIWEKLSSTLVHFVERIFFTLGVIVARHPWRTIAITWTFLLLSCIGLMRFHIEKNPLKLWVPPESDFLTDTNWYIEKFGTGFRLQRILIVADDVLDPEVLMKIYNITKEVESLQIKTVNETISIKSLCYEVPVVNFYTEDKKSEGDFSDPTLWADDDFYCSFLETFPVDCLRYNVLDLWKNDLEQISNVTKDNIITKIVETKTNPVTGHPTDFSKLLGGVKKSASGDIVSASSVLLTWYTQVNMSEVDLNAVGNLVGTEDWVSLPLAMWETEFLGLMHSISNNASEIKIYYEAGRSFGDVSGQAMFQEMDKLFVGVALMFLYILYALSRFNWLEIKFTLGSVGMLCIGMAYITAISWCSVFEIPFGPVHSSLPFLLMGLGIDDMFVMNACWENLSDTESRKSLPVKVGLMLKHAGVSIVITSFTDIVALLIGAITILPSLKSFCIYAAAGVFFIFCYSVTYYVAIFTLDVRRMEANRNGIFYCYRHKHRINMSVKKTWFQKMLSLFYKNIVFTVPGKSVVILFTVIMTGFSTIAIFKLEQRFDPKWFIPEGTYYKDFLTNHETLYPEEGNAAFVFLGKMNYSTEFLNLYNMVQELKQKPYVKDMVDWVEPFREYVLANYDRDLKNTSTVADKDFNKYLSKFLFSSLGGRYQINIRFPETPHCGRPTGNVIASSFYFNYPRFEGPEEYIPAMNDVKHIVKSTNISTGDGYRSAWAKVFGNWVTDEIIAVEVERNIELALLCVMMCTVILITNLQMCLWIFICVLLTIVNVLGWMQRWAMTVDIVCCIGLELAIGLCVDYAAHVGHTFLTVTEGSREDRAHKTVTSIGSAVLLGGGSTLLSLSLLSMSKAYTFKAFFKIFLLVILFGLFNGLIFLPVMLSLVGPNAYKPPHDKNNKTEIVELNGKERFASDKNIEDG
ncbi:NPC intracellular cholesterol transporter 1-like [Pectinophora gossypiella]|uniref:SSD domain-containing protein n=1 Tax=Pectinophora gossypiella TaxID=13191 RepID=A0A1E1WD18_PECGO|nr:NPC intracellular cholesterol transporter 1-like [Pectinophora gossypiella]